ncbi:MAG TPA: hypothetical protein VK623_04100 [Flavobacterium sp.]|nr:hypothetical protein [Flavobacterium sp.]
MLSIKKEIHIASLLLAGILFNSNSLYSQSNANTSLYEWFDNANGKENLAIYNGTLHVNLFRTLDKTNHMYYSKDEFVKGDVAYDGQFYYGVDLKYDIYKDELIVKPQNETYKSITLIKQKTDSFFFYGKSFVNLSKKPNIPDFIKGYYEVSLDGNRFTFYIKYHKNVSEKIVNDANYSNFKEDDTFILYYKNAYSEISSRKDLLAIFPEYKNKIKAFYSDNYSMDKANHTTFMENIMKYINNLPQ